MEEQKYLQDVQRRTWERFSGRTPWDYVIITASNASQGKGFQAQLEERRDMLPAKTRFGIVPDPEGERVGNGGALLGALRFIREREPGFQGIRALVILSSGDSRRVPQYSALGKIFSPVPRTLPDGRASTLFDEAMLALSPIPDRIREGILVISGDVMLSFDAENFDPGDMDAAAIAFPEKAATGAGHGVFLRNAEGNIGRVWHKQKPEMLRQYGAVDADGNVQIDTGAVFFSPRALDGLYSLVCKDGMCTDASFHEVVNAHLAPSLYVDFFYPLAEESTFEGYLREVPEGSMSEDLLKLRRRIWDVLRPFRIRLCSFAPSRFIHFGTAADVADLMSRGISDYAFLDWERQVQSHVSDSSVAAWHACADPASSFGKNVYLEECMVEKCRVGNNVILSGVCVRDREIPEDVVLHCLKQTDGTYVTRVLGVHDNPKLQPGQDGLLLGKPMTWLEQEKDIWGENEERTLWNARIYPVCGSMEESVDQALAFVHMVRSGEIRDAWRNMHRESLFGSFCRADGAAIHAWHETVSEILTARH